MGVVRFLRLEEGVYNIFPTAGINIGVFLAIHSITKLFADEYASKNIRMNNILPGFINSKGLPEKEEIKSRIPLNRYGTTGEISSLVSFLASSGRLV